MLNFIYQSGWGAFTVLLLFQIPFLLVFLTVVYRKAYVNTAPSDMTDADVGKWRGRWLGLVIALFLVVNLASIQFIPAIYTAKANASGVAATRAADTLLVCHCRFRFCRCRRSSKARLTTRSTI